MSIHIDAGTYAIGLFLDFSRYVCWE